LITKSGWSRVGITPSKPTNKGTYSSGLLCNQRNFNKRGSRHLQTSDFIVGSVHRDRAVDLPLQKRQLAICGATDGYPP
jgi:hypothetical protein